MKSWVALISGCMILVASHLALGEDQHSANLQKIRNDYLSAVARLESHFAALRGSGKYSIEAFWSGDRSSSSFSVEFARKTGASKTISSNGVASTPKRTTQLPDSIVCSNQLMSFKLEKKPGAKSFIIARLEESGKAKPAASAANSVITSQLNCAYNPGGRPILAYLSDPKFALYKADEVKSNNKKMLKLYFRFDGRLPERPKTSNELSEMSILVSPEEQWVIYQFEAHTVRPGGLPNPIMSVGSVEYSGAHEGVPVPKLAISRDVVKLGNGEKELKYEKRTLSDGTTMSVQTLEIHHLDFEVEPDSSFTLAAFGLPDSGQLSASNRRSNTSVWFFVSAVFFLAMALAIRKYGSRLSSVRNQKNS